ncbi:MAG: bifunctional demethylmenaquinone methyltransferase/2-methoxy-6-polyprenyl-1,4-benzoquinol methylase UbiE [Opitutales bacterium]|nr:bifunctional demethylmenaquinone methyltransferase/2-methoxy-6-polyprenyl-1,4-benzoquinol methylase UbiE [Opitutales bacterium]
MSEKIKCPADSKVREASSVKQMFSRVAPFYDFINRAMTFGLDIVWRKRLVRLLELSNGDVRVIDIACGSGDVAIEIAKQNPNAKIVCSDFCVPMLEIAEAKFAKKYPNRAEFKEADCEHLPFKNGLFDGATISFGFRNFRNRQKCLKEIARVLKTNGCLCILEVSRAEGFFRFAQKIFMGKIVPTIASVCGGVRADYEYLAKTTLEYPSPSEVEQMFVDAGFENVSTKKMAFGLVSITSGNKADKRALAKNLPHGSEFGEVAGFVDMDEFPSWIIYEDENFLALNKPGWLVCHPSKNGPLSSLVGAAREYLGADILHLVSRLDRETSGIVLLAKNKKTASMAQKALEVHNDVGKTYLALLEGKLVGSYTVSQPLADDKKSLVAIKTCCAIQKLSAKTAVTMFTPVAYSTKGDYTLAEVKIITGRKHQIRAHAQWINHCVVADKIYGHDETLYLDFIEKGITDEMAKLLPMKRQALHAFEMDFSKVFSGLKFRAPLQDDFKKFMADYGIELPEKFQ